MRARKLDTGHVDVRCLLVVDGEGRPTQMLTEADLIHAILPWVFREKRFADYVGKWLDSSVPEAAVEELLHDLVVRARKRTVQDITRDRPMVSVDEGASMLKVAYTMYAENIKTVPVAREGKIVGVVYRAAVFEALADRVAPPRPAASA
jgi:predicted transcriptional regulator